jgi:hypothetical protein
MEGNGLRPALLKCAANTLKSTLDKLEPESDRAYDDAVEEQK